MRLNTVALAVLLVVASHASAGVLELACRVTIGEDEPADFIVAVDLVTSVISERDFRWTTTDGDTTIDWSVTRARDVLRAVILTGPDAGLQISGSCGGTA
jgi:hypothetical protein